MKNILLIILLLGITLRGESQHLPEKHHILNELTVSNDKKQKYSKRNNPAVTFVREVMDRRDMADPALTNPYYQHNSYERINLGVINFMTDSTGLLRQYAEPSPLSGDPVVNLTVKEKVSDIYYQRSPKQRKEVVVVRKQNGLDDLVANSESMQALFNDLFRPINIYKGNDIAVMQTRFVSPLGRVATDFYKYYLSDTIADPQHGDSLIVLSFMPHNPAMNGFNGRLYVVKDDSTRFIRRVEMRLPKSANVNYIDQMRIIQEYDRAPNGSRLLVLDDFAIELSWLGQRLQAGRVTMNNTHRFRPPSDPSLWDDPRDIIEPTGIFANIASYRPANASDAASTSSRMDGLVNHLLERPWLRTSLKILKTLFRDRLPLGGNKAPIEYGPIFSSASYNDLEGLRLRGGLQTTPQLSRRWFASGYAAYGFADHKWKYGGWLEHSFNAKQKTPLEFPVRSLRLSHTYDVDKLGQAYSSLRDELFASLTFNRNDLLTYRRRTALEFNYETYSQLSFKAALALDRQEATRTVTFTDGYGRQFAYFNQGLAWAEVRFAPGEKYYQSNNRRVSINFDAPIITLRHTFSPANAFGAATSVNKTEASIYKRLWLSAWGLIDFHINGGHVWSTTNFPYLLAPEANISYIWRQNAFSLLNALEFINDSYASVHINYQANGALFNYIPLLNRLKLRECVGFQALWGHLSSRNNPDLNPALLRFPQGVATQAMTASKPYMEFNAGIGNILGLLRLDYVRRLSYLNTPGTQRHGIRFSLKLSF